MNSIRHLVLGTARSGKTRFALNTAQALANTLEKQTIYVATAEAHDDEMRARIARHRAERPTSWHTLEASRELASALASIKKHEASEDQARRKARSSNSAPTSNNAPTSSHAIVIVDCLTLWLSNALLHDFDENNPTAALPTWTRERESFMRWLEASEHTVILVSNEVGGGIVPTSALARRFQSEQGWLNQDVARLCERVTLVVAGLPMTLKTP